MNKTELVAAVAAKAGLSKDQASKALNAFEDAVTEELKTGGSVALVGFGTFSVKAREARIGRNPKTGEAIEIAASNAPAFKAGSKLKEAVNS